MQQLGKKMYKSSLVNSKVLHSMRQVSEKLGEGEAGNSAYPCGKNDDTDSIQALNRDAATKKSLWTPWISH